MNKIICTFIVLLLIATVVLPVIGKKNIGETKESENIIVSTLDDPPEWAYGEFNGTYGKIIFGQHTDELGWAKGYWASDPIGYSLFEKGRIECYFGEWENEEPNSVMETNLFSYYYNYFYRSILIGSIKETATDNEKFCICPGKIGMDRTLNYNMLIFTGDNIYFKGTYSEF